ncbi:putative Rossmann fold nucleotide-binding protein DprA/Smf involved in DNA uptake [Pedobacter sp. CAN_A7]|uniref:DNA-processing protein DprA n=1 Tax=Pedobacter sp. CAN_A7 TaxID=2787722 RepID=UPI0018CA5E55
MTERTKATLLFTAYFSKTTDKVHKPLSLTEWNKFVRWQQTKNLSPEIFLSNESETILADWNDQGISKNRLLGLLERKAALGIALDKWSRAGVWIINRGDQDYPSKIKEKLKGLAPSIFFGIGNKELLQQHYAGVVGSRATDELDLEHSNQIGQKMVQQKYGIVSGGAKGVDEAAMLGALDAGGSSVGILADSLIKKSASSQYRKHIVSGKLVLMSPYNPEAGFNAGNAMSRNKLIYSMSDFSIVVKSDIKGGTWEGAKENLKNDWVPLWVFDSEEKGNREILKLGAKLLVDVSGISAESLKNPAKDSNQGTLFEKEPKPSMKGHKHAVNKEIGTSSTSECDLSKENNEHGTEFYELFLTQWRHLFKSGPVSKEMLCTRLGLTISQVEIWLEKALSVQSVSKQNEEDETWYSAITR